MASGLFSEVDLRREAKNLKLFAEAHAHLPYVTVSKIHKNDVDNVVQLCIDEAEEESK